MRGCMGEVERWCQVGVRLGLSVKRVKLSGTRADLCVNFLPYVLSTSLRWAILGFLKYNLNWVRKCPLCRVLVLLIFEVMVYIFVQSVNLNDLNYRLTYITSIQLKTLLGRTKIRDQHVYTHTHTHTHMYIFIHAHGLYNNNVSCNKQYNMLMFYCDLSIVPCLWLNITRS